MNIMDLDEADGLTAEMVRAYLQDKGWRKSPEAQRGGFKWTNSTTNSFICLRDWKLNEAVRLIASWERRSAQSILRDLNPRMRKSQPTDAEIEAHSIWLAHDEHGNPRVGYWTIPTFSMNGTPYHFYVQGRGFLTRERVAKWSFWPCDAHGNKCRWPKVSP